jgi:hypothetical protein
MDVSNEGYTRRLMTADAGGLEAGLGHTSSLRLLGHGFARNKPNPISRPSWAG